MTKIAGSGSVCQRYRYTAPDPYQNVTDPQHGFLEPLKKGSTFFHSINQTTVHAEGKNVDLGVWELAEPEHGAAGLDGLDNFLAGVAGQRKPTDMRQIFKKPYLQINLFSIYRGREGEKCKPQSNNKKTDWVLMDSYHQRSEMYIRKYCGSGSALILVAWVGIQEGKNHPQK